MSGKYKKLYQGIFSPKNPKKYVGDVSNICFRSGWEFSVMFWCDHNPKVVSWSSEEIVIPYISPIDGKRHRYYVDFKITFDTGKTILVEIKPRKDTVPPKKKDKPTKRHLNEVVTYLTNEAKWKHAKEYAADRGWTFFVWTEDTLNSLGIRVLNK